MTNNHIDIYVYLIINACDYMIKKAEGGII